MFKTLKLVSAMTVAAALTIAAAQTATPAKSMSMSSSTMSMPASKMSGSMKTPSMAGMMKVNVNTASAAALTQIPGVSSAIAAAIIKNRPYRDSAELVKKVKGIGPKNVMKMQPMLSF